MSAPSVPVASWQSTKAPQAMPEVFKYSFTLDLAGEMDLKVYAEAFRPNLPWADDHFREERASGCPINPGRTWRTWPFARSADTHRREGAEDPQFDHSYAERYWPRFAGLTKGGTFGPEEGTPDKLQPRQGVRFRYGDLADLVEVLGKDPLTRQAYLPVWFPEDLGAAVEGKRVPCTLGYHFIMRNGLFHCIYPMRSCDFIRHFRDDVYLTVRLQLWVLSMLRFRFPEAWAKVNVGTFTMHITSLHLFEQDRENLRKAFK
jgi:thymidylate synthase